MVFGYDVPVKFTVEGACTTASVHLTGYFQPGPDDENEDDEDDEDGESSSTYFRPQLGRSNVFDQNILLDEDMDEEMYKKLIAEGGGDDDDDGKHSNLDNAICPTECIISSF